MLSSPRLSAAARRLALAGLLVLSASAARADTIIKLDLGDDAATDLELQRRRSLDGRRRRRGPRPATRTRTSSSSASSRPCRTSPRPRRTRSTASRSTGSSTVLAAPSRSRISRAAPSRCSTRTTSCCSRSASATASSRGRSARPRTGALFSTTLRHAPARWNARQLHHRSRLDQLLDQHDRHQRRRGALGPAAAGPSSTRSPPTRRRASRPCPSRGRRRCLALARPAPRGLPAYSSATPKCAMYGARLFRSSAALKPHSSGEYWCVPNLPFGFSAR